MSRRGVERRGREKNASEKKKERKKKKKKKRKSEEKVKSKKGKKKNQSEKKEGKRKSSFHSLFCSIFVPFFSHFLLLLPRSLSFVSFPHFNVFLRSFSFPFLSSHSPLFFLSYPFHLRKKKKERAPGSLHSRTLSPIFLRRSGSPPIGQTLK